MRAGGKQGGEGREKGETARKREREGGDGKGEGE